MKHWMLVAGPLFGALAVVTGAFGAHGLKARLSLQMLEIWQTAVQYHFYHAFALCIAGLLLWLFPSQRRYHWSGLCFTVGVLVFSGSLYMLALTGIRWLGAVTPVGGVLFIAGWLLMGWAGWRGLQTDSEAR